MTTRFIHSIGTAAAAAVIGWCSTPACAGTIPIATGPVPGVDGYLRVAPDAYGAWASTTFGGGGDLFKPVGHGGLEAAFTSGLFLFVPGRNQRELLTDNSTWQDVVGADASLDRAVTAPLACLDTNADLIDDQCTSSFRAFGGGTDLGFGLTQNVAAFGPGVAFMRQDYSVTNNGSTAVTFNMVRAFDGDLLWVGDFSNDEVGTGVHGSGFDPFVFEEEVGESATAVTVSSALGNHYYGGKLGVTPPGGPAYGYGTDVQVWDALGIPVNWENHIAGVGYDTNGTSGATPPGSTSPFDAYVGLDATLTLGPGEEALMTVFHTYGQDTPVPEPTTIALLALGAAAALRRRPDRAA